MFKSDLRIFAMHVPSFSNPRVIPLLFLCFSQRTSAFPVLCSLGAPKVCQLHQGIDSHQDVGALSMLTVNSDFFKLSQDIKTVKNICNYMNSSIIYAAYYMHIICICEYMQMIQMIVYVYICDTSQEGNEVP